MGVALRSWEDLINTVSEEADAAHLKIAHVFFFFVRCTTVHGYVQMEFDVTFALKMPNRHSGPIVMCMWFVD